ncbi:DUF1800 family protein [Bryobacter aggregatus]|uniref:DUF1800 family protein n=1 Tax=Bryobacter aggregatus TaxID=360054 RepID=UPI00068D8B4C|nr:DUF1800 family protein [Bryobacter aggregatus]
MDSKINFCILALLTAASVQAQTITVYPGPSGIPKASSRQMSAYVPLSPNTVTWSVNGIIGGDPVHGTVSQNGLYTAPAEVPPDNLITIQVASTAYPTKIGTASLSITQPLVYIWGSNPNKFAAGAVSLNINGAGFVPGVAITINDLPLTTTYLSATSLKVTGSVPASMVGVAVLRAINPNPGSTISDPVNVTVASSNVSVSVNPASVSLPVTGTQSFSASVSGSSNLAVTWSTTAGTITASGLYTAPATLPSPPTATVTAKSVADPLISASATITLTKPSATVSLTPPASSAFLGSSTQFTATVNGPSDTSVTWAVNGIAGGNSSVGFISGTGLYTAPLNLPNPASVTVRATSVAAPTIYAQASVTLKLTPPAMPNLTHARFLEQAAFGPTSAELATLGQIGIDGWLAQQFSLPETPIPVPAGVQIAQSQYFSRLVHAPDQLRQRMIDTLAKIIVVSAAKNSSPNEVVPWLQILSRNTFGNYRQLLWDITVSPQMGKYLDLANSQKATGNSMPNENYAREVMQLFTTGLVLLNPDGTPQLDSQGNTIATYDQTTVSQMAKALTGWTFPTPAGGQMGGANWESFNAPSMEVREQFHDKTAKTLIGGCAIPAGLTVAAETNQALDCLFNHPNTAPFVVLRLIRALVTSNPSGPYVQRVVNVWNNNGAGTKGDLKAVLTAILTDAEARQDQATPQQGRLKDAEYGIVEFIRSLQGTLTPDNLRVWSLTTMGQTPLAAPSVFGHYSLLYRIQGGTLAGPEFQIYSPTEAILRGNFFYELLLNPNASDLSINLAPFNAVAADANALIEQVNATLLYGRMPQSLKDSLATAIAAASDNNQRVITALYLTALSGYYTVQY